MKEQLLRQLHSVKTMSIVGMCKNAGKTTMLNWLLEQGRLQGVLGLTSIGRDGESTDVVTGTEKPGIFVREGTLIATAQDMLRLGDITKEILMTTGIPTPLGGGHRPGPQRRIRPVGRALHHHPAQDRVPGVL